MRNNNVAAAANKENTGAKRVKNLLFTLLALAFWVGVWQLISMKVAAEWILPSPGRVMEALLTEIGENRLPARVGRSLLGILEGYAAGVGAGVLLSVLTARVKALHVLFSPLLTIVRATPVASFILILWVFVARGSVPAISVFLIVTPIIWANCETGFLSFDKKLFEVGRVYGFSPLAMARYIYIPAAYPYFRTAALTALGMGWKAGIAAEVLCSPDGTVGQMILRSKNDIQTADLFAYTLAAVAVCYALEKLLSALFSIAEKRKKSKKSRRRESA